MLNNPVIHQRLMNDIISLKSIAAYGNKEILYSENDVFRYGEKTPVNEGSVYFQLPAVKPKETVPVIEIILK